MSTGPEFLTYVLDLFTDLGAVSTNKMFGGTGLYIDGAMFAVVFGDTLYMKADKTLATEYTANGSVPFQYDTKTGVRIIAGLTSLPENALDDPDEALIWARKSLVPAQKAAVKRRKSKAKKT